MDQMGSVASGFVGKSVLYANLIEYSGLLSGARS